ncbi:uncharacterized protein LOC117115924, partial [Anneissia japonica]|uniref:uncharacterized protein LOC117115924 n=1 Tax=Anneissia japonica TaxID=1529436 RepID=UPI0014259097
MVSASPMIDFLCFPPISGRYVTILGNSGMSICEVRVYGENINVQPVSQPLDPVSTWPLNKLCGINDIYSLDLSKISNQYNFVTDKHSLDEGALNVSKNEALTASTRSGWGDVGAMTLTVFIHPYTGSSGGILIWLSSQYSIRLSVFSNILHVCEVVVRYYGAEVMRANVLQTDAWTFLGLTFDGNLHKMEMWRDGEIVKTAGTIFDVVHMSFRRVNLTKSSTGAHMGFSRLQLFDRVLTEVEMKAFRDEE